MVRLLLRQQAHQRGGGLGFNPTMVRLLQILARIAAAVRRKFQSHNGAIAAQRCCLMMMIRKEFQSHNGAIAACPPKNFNIDRVLFQSHNGAIAALTRFPTRSR